MAEALVAGWDLGGAHLKLAVAGSGGVILKALQVPCPLWLGLDRLRAALNEARSHLDGIPRHGITMTGELVDLFDSRAEGVARLTEAMVEAFPEADLQIYAGERGFLAPRQAAEAPDRVASANWLASASYVAARLPEALFLDLGSTTADILALCAGRVETTSLSDAERLASEELVYTGITRTPVMAVAGSVPFGGRRQALMAEFFATMADVHRLTRRLPEHADQHPAADNGPKTAEASARRLARMLGRNLEDADMAAWQRLARHLAECQVRQLQDAADRTLSRGLLGDRAPLVGAGVGRFLLADLAERLSRPYRDFATLVEGDEETRYWAACCAPAAAVALLALEAG